MLKLAISTQLFFLLALNPIAIGSKHNPACRQAGISIFFKYSLLAEEGWNIYPAMRDYRQRRRKTNHFLLILQQQTVNQLCFKL